LQEVPIAADGKGDDQFSNLVSINEAVQVVDICYKEVDKEQLAIGGKILPGKYHITLISRDAYPLMKVMHLRSEIAQLE
jgi:hypothetical protein